MGTQIYMFDNGTGRDIPEKVDTFPIELLVGSKVSEIHASMMPNSQLFVVFTHLPENTDIVVPTKKDAEMIQNILDFAKYNYKVVVKESGIWYTDKVDKNMIISDSVTISAKDLSTMLMMYLSNVRKNNIAEGKVRPKEMYTVLNDRSGKEVLKTPFIDEAIKVCDKNPCCEVLNRNGEFVYKSRYGKVNIPYKKETHAQQYKSRLKAEGRNAASFNIEG